MLLARKHAQVLPRGGEPHCTAKTNYKIQKCVKYKKPKNTENTNIQEVFMSCRRHKYTLTPCRNICQKELLSRRSQWLCLQAEHICGPSWLIPYSTRTCVNSLTQSNARAYDILPSQQIQLIHCPLTQTLKPQYTSTHTLRQGVGCGHVFEWGVSVMSTSQPRQGSEGVGNVAVVQ